MADVIVPQDFIFKLEPYAHQLEGFLMSRDAKDWALLMEMGTGKTKVGIDTAAWLYQNDKIDMMVVVAPNGVHENWIDRELPKHMVDQANYRGAVWQAGMGKRKTAAMEDMLYDREHPGLKVLAMNVEAFGSTDKATKLLRKLCNMFRVMLIVDESTKIKTPGATCTRKLTTIGKYAAYKRIMTGSPVTNSPLDVFAQFRFLGDYLRFTNFTSFKNHYAEWKIEHNHKTDRDYPVLTGYKNIDELTRLMDKVSYRVTKKECLDLPEKVYTRRTYAMTPDQKKAYVAMRDKMEAEIIEAAGPTLLNVQVSNVLTKMLRLQQITSGYVVPEAGADAVDLFKEDRFNPRMRVLKEVTDELAGKAIIWCRFQPDIQRVSRYLRKEFGQGSVVEYHGKVSKADRSANVDAFQDNPDVRWFIGQQHAGGYGLTLTAAETVVYYSNDFSLEARLQSEDRAHRIGQKKNVLYVDIECPGTVDTKIINALRGKKNLADMITRDDPTTWL